MLHQLVIMGLEGIIGGGLAGATEDTGKSEQELLDILEGVHERMNAAGREAIEQAGFEFQSEGDVWTGVGAGLLSLLYLLHTKSTVAHIAERMGMDTDGEPTPVDPID